MVPGDSQGECVCECAVFAGGYARSHQVPSLDAKVMLTSVVQKVAAKVCYYWYYSQLTAYVC